MRCGDAVIPADMRMEETCKGVPLKRPTSTSPALTAGERDRVMRVWQAVLEAPHAVESMKHRLSFCEIGRALFARFEAAWLRARPSRSNG